jgi:uncharacterized protein YodC (DUF2158 family)
MTLFQAGDLVVLKSGGPTMTVDAVNTSIFDDDEITGIICVWFVGEKLERVRFDLRALEHLQNNRNAEEPSLETAGEYKVVLDEMADAMNHLVEETHSPSKVGIKRQRPARVPKDDNTLRAANDKL